MSLRHAHMRQESMKEVKKKEKEVGTFAPLTGKYCASPSSTCSPAAVGSEPLYLILKIAFLLQYWQVHWKKGGGAEARVAGAVSLRTSVGHALCQWPGVSSHALQSLGAPPSSPLLPDSVSRRAHGA